MSVQRVGGWYKSELNPEEIAERIEHLSLAQVHAALAYYHANRDEIESLIAADEIAADEEEGDRVQRIHTLQHETRDY